MAYMSDSYFIGTVARVHNLWRFGRPAKPRALTPSTTPYPTPTSDKAASSAPPKKHPMAEMEERENTGRNPLNEDSTPKQVGMMVSLDHTIYFHRPSELRADEWLFSEMVSPWAGDGRGLVFQQIWNRKGQLVATCIQEGLVRLKQKGDDERRGKKKTSKI
jgi:acyl-CoA thioesterase 8